MTPNPTWNRFVRFIDTHDRELCGQPEDPDVDVGLAVSSNKDVRVKVLSCSSPLEDGHWTGETVVIKKILSPLSRIDIGVIRCIGLNFKDHAAELRCALPEVPEVFFKPAECLNDPCSAIVVPATAPSALDAEVELAVVIGKECKDVDEASALDYVLGYTVANDVTARDIQARVSQWGFSKGYDGFCPLGPVIVRADSPGLDIRNLKMTTTLNGETLQDGNSSEMIFSVENIVSYLSQGTTLAAGTVIITGTPSGIGHSYKPPKYLEPGNDLKVSIGGGLGTLVNPIAAV